MRGEMQPCHHLTVGTRLPLSVCKLFTYLFQSNTWRHHYRSNHSVCRSCVAGFERRASLCCRLRTINRAYGFQKSIMSTIRILVSSHRRMSMTLHQRWVPLLSVDFECVKYKKILTRSIAENSWRWGYKLSSTNVNKRYPASQRHTFFLHCQSSHVKRLRWIYEVHLISIAEHVL